MMRKPHHCGSLESYLAEDGILEEAACAATRKVIAAQIAFAVRPEKCETVFR